MSPWICPKCGRVWGPMVTGCGNCNAMPIAMPGTNPVLPTMPPALPYDQPTNTPLPPLPRITCSTLREGETTTVDAEAAAAAARHLAEHAALTIPPHNS